MADDRIRRAMNAGKRWALEQVEAGVVITPSLAENAARNRFRHLGLQHLFIISALDVLFEVGSAAGFTAGIERKAAS